MKITDIQRAKGERYRIYLDDEYFATLDAEIIMQNHLRLDKEVDAEAMEELLWQAERRKARERGYYLLSYRDHSKKELYDKLLGSARPEIALSIIELLEEQGLLNDEEYANKRARYYLENKKWGGKKVYYELLRRGIDKETAREAIDSCEVDPIPQIKAIIEKKYYDCVTDYKARQKATAALLRMGFDYGAVKAAIELEKEEYQQEHEQDATQEYGQEIEYEEGFDEYDDEHFEE